MVIKKIAVVVMLTTVAACGAAKEWKILDDKAALHASEDNPHIVAGMFVSPKTTEIFVPSIHVLDARACGGAYDAMFGEYQNTLTLKSLTDEQVVNVRMLCNGKLLAILPKDQEGLSKMSLFFASGRFKVLDSESEVSFNLQKIPETLALITSRRNM